MAGSSTPLISWSRQSCCWSDVRALPRRFIDHSIGFQCVVDQISGHIEHTLHQLSVLYCHGCYRRCDGCVEIIIFWSTVRLSLQIIILDQTCSYTWRPQATHAVIMPFVALCSLYVLKISLLNFMDAFICYKQKKLVTFNLAHPVDPTAPS